MCAPEQIGNSVKILVVDDHALVREGLCQVLKGLDDEVEVLQAGNCAQAYACAAQHANIDLVLLDYHLPDQDGLDAMAVLATRHPDLPVVILSGNANMDVMQQVLRAGASGFVTKSSLSDELLQAVRTVLDGGVHIPPELAHAAGATDTGNTRTRLTQRQELVLKGLLDGKSNRDIAEQLFLAEETVKSHVAAILRYFDVQNRTQAVVAATRSGFRSGTAR